MVNSKRSAAAKKGWATRRAQQANNGDKFAAQVVAATKKTAASELTTPVIKEWFADKYMHQIYSTGLEYAWVSAEGKQCHAFAFCKDFLQDAVWATINKKKTGIYGFSYDHQTNPPVDLKKCRLALRLKGDNKFQNKCLKALDFVHAFEKEHKIKPSQLRLGGKYQDDTDEVLVFVGSPQWLHSPTMVSLYTLVLRVGMTYEGGPWREHFDAAKEYISHNDKSYTTRAKEGLKQLEGKKVEEVFAKKLEDNYPEDVEVAELHERSGILAFSEGKINKKVKLNWHQS